MQYNPQKNQIIIETTDPLFDTAVKFFKVKSQGQQNIAIPIKKIAGFIEYLSRNNNGTTEFLLHVSELVLIQIESRYGTNDEEYRLAKIELDVKKLGYNTAKLANENHDTKRVSYKPIIFLIDKKNH